MFREWVAARRHVEDFGKLTIPQLMVLHDSYEKVVDKRVVSHAEACEAIAEWRKNKESKS